MRVKSSALNDLIQKLRDHPAFDEFCTHIDGPSVPLYMPGKDRDKGLTDNDWAFRSGQYNQHAKWMVLLTGREPSRKWDNTAQEKSSG